MEMENEDRKTVARKLDRLKRLCEAAEQMKNAGWLSDVEDPDSRVAKLKADAEEFAKDLEREIEEDVKLALVKVESKLSWLRLFIRNSIVHQVHQVLNADAYYEIRLTFLEDGQYVSGQTYAEELQDRVFPQKHKNRRKEANGEEV